MKDEKFQVRSYGWQELAQLYHPGVLPLSAVKRFSQWINRNPNLHAELSRYGWRKGTRLLTPIQVAIIVDHLGEP